MRVSVFYCPKCKKFPSHLLEQRAETHLYSVLICNPHARFPDLEYINRDLLDSEYLAVECPLCKQTIAIGYGAEDFIIVYDPDSNEIKELGMYFTENPNELPSAKAIKEHISKRLD